MSRMIKAIRHIQLNKIAYTPNLYKAVITYEPHPTKYDESDDLEYQKDLINKLINEKWFYNIITQDYINKSIDNIFDKYKY